MYGYDRNWERLCLTLEGFRSRYGAWPKRVRLFDVCFEELRSLLRPADFSNLTSKVALWPDNAGFVAEDDEGHVFDYGQEADIEAVTGEKAQAWLGVKPVSGEDLFGWDDEGGTGQKTDAFALNPGQWYAMEMWGAFSSDDPHDSPVKIRLLRAAPEGHARFDMAFFHAKYPGGGRHREVTLRVLHRGRRWLVALRANAPEEAVMVFFPLTRAWLKERASVQLRARDKETIGRQLDVLYRLDQPNTPAMAR